MTDLAHLRADFPILDSGVHFLDSSASSQKPAPVLEAMDRFARTSYANVHRGAYRLSLAATDAYEAARRRVADFIGAANPSEVVFTRGTTTSLNMVAFGWGIENLLPGDRILTTVMEHHANLVPWQMVAKRTGAVLDHVPLTDDCRLDMRVLGEKMVPGVRIVAVSGMSNVLGTIPDVPAISSLAHAVGARVVVDAAQLVPHAGVDVSTLGSDFVAFSSHKMLGPTGIGVLWGRMEALEEMEPFEGGGEMISDVTLHDATWAPIPHRFEAGTPPIIEAVGLHAAIDYLDSIGMDKIYAHDQELTAVALERLSDVPGLVLHGPAGIEARGGVVSMTMEGTHAHDLATILDEGDVAVRSGHHCAKPLMRELGVTATARASFYLYNTEDDIDALVAGLRRAGEIFGVR
ncbi:MAG: SufS family cysteine desulfurase [Actinobacteria bacterium]|nr:SufS family cysteine desulfurase [Actinomycetota bacterium]MCI0678302.1 SufS family cysteine desulfurase [Actinomycetota bacterium]